MKPKFYLFAIVLLLNACATTQKATEFNCEATFDSEATLWKLPGVVSLRAVAYGNSKESAKEAAKKCAVRSVLFKGIPGSQCQKPLIDEPLAEQKNASFYKEFFKTSGTYLSFVSETTVDQMIRERSGYRAGLFVKVNYSQLQTYLENANQIKRLNY